MYLPGTTVVHTCDARAKLVLLLLYSILLFWADTWVGLALFCLVLFAVQGLARIAPARVFVPLVPVVVLAAFTVLFNAIPFSWEGLARGAFFGCRMLVLVAASYVVCFTTTSEEAVAAFTSLIRPLSHLRFPVDDAAAVLSLSLRFIPLMAVQYTRIRDAQTARGARMDEGSFVQRLKAWSAVFVPLFISMFQRADAVSVAMDARCYGASPARTSLSQRAFAPRDVATLVVGALVLVAIAAAF